MYIVATSLIQCTSWGTKALWTKGVPFEGGTVCNVLGSEAEDGHSVMSLVADTIQRFVEMCENPVNAQKLKQLRVSTCSTELTRFDSTWASLPLNERLEQLEMRSMFHCVVDGVFIFIRAYFWKSQPPQVKLHVA